jgi:hypothetical protein
MGDRSLIATPDGIQQAKIALKEMQLNQTTLLARLPETHSVTRQPISKFFNGKPVNNDLFVQICKTLKLDWMVVCGLRKSESIALTIVERGDNEVLIDASAQSISDAMRQIKQAADTLLANDHELQEFLCWVSKKSNSTKTRYKLSTLRAFYFWLARNRDSTLFLDFGTDLELHCLLDPAFAHDIGSDYEQIDIRLGLDLTLSSIHANFHDLINYKDFSYDSEMIVSVNTYTICQSLPLAHDFTQKLNFPIDFQEQLWNLYVEVPDQKEIDQKGLVNWWTNNGSIWGEMLEKLMIEHCNIGHNWHWTPEKLQKLDRYFSANKFLVDCLNNDCIITPNIRIEIENMLFLPFEEIKNLKSINKRLT